MGRMIAAMLTCAMLTTLTVVDAQDTKGQKAKTQADIMRERSQACAGLRDEALQECLDNYVGPSRDATTGEDAHGSSDDKKAHAGENRNSEDAEREGSANGDMTKSKKRAPVGPIRGGSEDTKQ